MKKLLFLLLLAAPFVFVACGDEEEEPNNGSQVTKEVLIGKWVFESVKVKTLNTNNDLTTELIKALIPSMPELIDLGNLNLPDYAEFKSDNTVSMSGGLGEGTYSLSGGKLTIVTESGAEYLTAVIIDGKLAIEKDVTEIVQGVVNEKYAGTTINKAVVDIYFKKVTAEDLQESK
jgi:hypothetical protein